MTDSAEEQAGCGFAQNSEELVQRLPRYGHVVPTAARCPSLVPFDGPRPRCFWLCFRCKAATALCTHVQIFLQDRFWEADGLAAQGLLLGEGHCLPTSNLRLDGGGSVSPPLPSCPTSKPAKVRLKVIYVCNSLILDEVKHFPANSHMGIVWHALGLLAQLTSNVLTHRTLCWGARPLVGISVSNNLFPVCGVSFDLKDYIHVKLCNL